jgi:predicted regulator of amino acid metabolism with ACT domain
MSSLKLRPKKELIIALEDLDFTWYPTEVEKVKKLWKYGRHIRDIAKQVRRDIDEVAVLIMHLARKKEIKRRKMGVLGN